MPLPRIDLADKDVTLTDAAIQTLAAQHADFDLDHVQPTGVLGRVMELQALKDAMRLGRGKVSYRAPAVWVERLSMTTRMRSASG